MTETLENKIGLTDMLRGTLAIVSKKLREKDPETLGISKDNLYNGIRELRKNPAYKELKTMDFETIGDNDTYSYSLDNFLFMAGTWGFLRNMREGNKTGYIILRTMSEEIIKKFQKEYSEEEVKRVEAMAEEFLKYIENSKK